MSKCPICYTEYIEGTIENCPVCHWDLKPYSLPKSGKYQKAYGEKEQAYINWAREMWQKYLVQYARPVSPLSNLMPWQNHHQTQTLNSDPADESLILQLYSRLNELESRLPQAEAKIQKLQAELVAEKEHITQLQSQMEWVLYVLQEANPQEMQETLWQLQEWANVVASSQPQTSRQSEVGMDYSKLEKLLAAGKWREADERTWAIMLRVANQEERGFLYPEDIELFPCTDLGTIARLWQDYSEGRFGLAVQKIIWESVGEDYTNFCDRVGWRIKDNWLYYEDLNCSLEAKQGHLPVIGWRKRACYGMGGATAQESLAALISRFAESSGVTI